MNDDMTNTRRHVERAALENGETLADLDCYYHAYDEDDPNWYRDGHPVIHCRGDELPERRYDRGYGLVEGEPAICYSERFVYFRTGYDGFEEIQSIARHPDHIGKHIEHYYGGG